MDFKGEICLCEATEDHVNDSIFLFNFETCCICKNYSLILAYAERAGWPATNFFAICKACAYQRIILSHCLLAVIQQRFDGICY